MDAPSSVTEVKTGATSSREKVDLPEERIAPDRFDERYVTTKKEIYAYYWCVHSTLDIGLERRDLVASQLLTPRIFAAVTSAITASHCSVCLYPSS